MNVYSSEIQALQDTAIVICESLGINPFDYTNYQFGYNSLSIENWRIEAIELIKLRARLAALGR